MTSCCPKITRPIPSRILEKRATAALACATAAALSWGASAIVSVLVIDRPIGGPRYLERPNPRGLSAVAGAGPGAYCLRLGCAANAQVCCTPAGRTQLAIREPRRACSALRREGYLRSFMDAIR